MVVFSLADFFKTPLSIFPIFQYLNITPIRAWAPWILFRQLWRIKNAPVMGDRERSISFARDWKIYICMHLYTSRENTKQKSRRRNKQTNKKKKQCLEWDRRASQCTRTTGSFRGILSCGEGQELECQVLILLILVFFLWQKTQGLYESSPLCWYLNVRNMLYLMPSWSAFYFLSVPVDEPQQLNMKGINQNLLVSV